MLCDWENITSLAYLTLIELNFESLSIMPPYIVACYTSALRVGEFLALQRIHCALPENGWEDSWEDNGNSSWKDRTKS